MDYRRRRIALALGVLALVAMTAERPTLDIRIAAVAPTETASRVQAAAKVGLAGVSVLVTWGTERLR